MFSAREPLIDGGVLRNQDCRRPRVLAILHRRGSPPEGAFLGRPFQRAHVPRLDDQNRSRSHHPRMRRAGPDRHAQQPRFQLWGCARDPVRIWTWAGVRTARIMRRQKSWILSGRETPKNEGSTSGGTLWQHGELMAERRSAPRFDSGRWKQFVELLKRMPGRLESNERAFRGTIRRISKTQDEYRRLMRYARQFRRIMKREGRQMAIFKVCCFHAGEKPEAVLGKYRQDGSFST